MTTVRVPDRQTAFDPIRRQHDDKPTDSTGLDREAPVTSVSVTRPLSVPPQADRQAVGWVGGQLLDVGIPVARQAIPARNPPPATVRVRRSGRRPVCSFSNRNGPEGYPTCACLRSTLRPGNAHLLAGF
jgi:hypothetical protein